MLVRVFSLNKFKSNCIKQGAISAAQYPSPWAITSDGRKVRGSTIVGTNYVASDDWIAYVDEKYVRR